MSGLPLGEIAAVTASFTWTIGSIMFANATRRMTPFRVNVLRIFVATFYVIVTHSILFNSPFPTATPKQWVFMSLSSLIGLVLGDFSYFMSLNYLGPRRAILMISTAPVFTIIAAFLILGEYLTGANYIGILITMTGVWLVISEREDRTGEAPLPIRRKFMGIIFGILAAVGQGVGLVLSKLGMVGVVEKGGEPLGTFPATLIRLIFATLFLSLIVIKKKDGPKIVEGIRDRKFFILVLIATFIGSFIGLWLSMVAVTYAKTGVASTLLSLMPVMVIPVLFLTDRQRTSLRGIMGASVTVIGVAVLFLV